MPDAAEYIVGACLLLGFFALGVFPLALELTVEATFPADQVNIFRREAASTDYFVRTL